MAMTAWFAKVLQQRTLLVRQRPGHWSQHAERADREIAAEHWHGCHRAVAGRQEIAGSDRQFCRHVLGVGNIHDPAIENGGAGYVVAREQQRHSASHCFDTRCIRSGDGCGPHLIPVGERNQDGGAGEQLEPACDNGSNTGWVALSELLITPKISAVAVCCSRDSVSSRVRCCSASNSRTFSIAITAWSAKVDTISICFCVNG